MGERSIIVQHSARGVAADLAGWLEVEAERTFGKAARYVGSPHSGARAYVVDPDLINEGPLETLQGLIGNARSAGVAQIGPRELRI